ncbi:MAG: SDR family NAD(P)-dependent oxidoreductase, partial [Symploca sp. SIO3E6]|nr:SDR family NAD(P)-dependent oxidoreductase [Caldora sp. SIO3E6]
MNLVEFLQDLTIQGWQLWANGERMGYRAPNQESTQLILSQLKQHKTEILRLLNTQPELLQVYPLSYSQQAMWFLWQLAPLDSVYNVSSTTRIYSQVDLGHWRQAFQALRKRHPMLRSTFPQRGQKPVQLVQEHQELDFLQIDASTWSQDELDRRLVKAHQHPFDLEREAVMRIRWFTRSKQDHLLLLTIHHIAVDGWSLDLILKELPKLYQAQTTTVELSLPPLKHCYQDYVKWQKDMLVGAEGKRLWNYWQQQLAGELPVLNLPTDRPRPTIQTYNGAAHHFQLSEKLSKQLKEITQKEKTTLYTTLLAAFQVLLYRYTAQAEILVGSPTSGRSCPEFAPIVGYFVESVVMGAKLSDKLTFQEFLTQVRQTVLEALDHQGYPFALLVDKLLPERDASRSPIFQVFFILQKIEQWQKLLSGELGCSSDWHGIKIEPYEIPIQESHFDLSLEMIPIGSCLHGFFRYNTDLFERETIVRMVGHFQTLLEAIVANPQQKLSQLPLLTAIEQQEILNNCNNQTNYPSDQCLHQLFENQVEKTPLSIAIIFKKQQLTYSQLNQKANQLAHYLLSLGITPETPVGIYIEPTPERIMALLAILKAGGAYQPIDLSQDLTSISVILTQAHLKSRLPQNSATILCLDSKWEIIAQENTHNPNTATTATNLAYILNQTLVEHHSLTQRLLWLKETLSITNNDILLHQTSLTHEVALLEIGLPLISGSSIVIASTKDPTELQKLIAKHNITIIHLWPSQMAAWLNTSNSTEEPSHWRSLLCSGELLSTELAESFTQRFNVSLENFYALPEAAGEVTHWHWQEKPTTENIPVGNRCRLSVYLLDQHQNPVPIGIPGEIYVGGSSLARGYLQQQQQSLQEFIEHPQLGKLFRTGDIARRRNNGELEVVGSRQRHVLIQGKRVQLTDIETALLLAPEVEQAYVLAHQNSLVAYVVVAGQWKPQKLHSHIQQQLPPYMMPQAYVPLSSLPLTHKGKVDEAALARFPVINDDLVQRWEAQLTAVPEIEQVAVVVQQKTPHLPPLHLSDLLPSGLIPQNRTLTDSVTPPTNPSPQPTYSDSKTLALSDGGRLIIPEDAPKTLTEALLRTATQFKEHQIIYIQADKEADTQTYGSLLEEAKSILSGLHHMGLTAGNRAILQIQSLRDYFPTLWACILGGIKPVTVAVATSYEAKNAVVKKLYHTWELLEQPPILASDSLIEHLDGLKHVLPMSNVKVVSVSKLRHHPPTTEIHHSHPEEVAFFQLTSGSTGTPKCIQETHRGIIAHIQAAQQFNGYQESDICLNWLPVDHVVPILTTHFKDVYLGCEQVEVVTEVILANPLTWLDLIEKYRITHSWAPNFGFKLVSDALLKVPDKTWDLSSIKFLMNAGEQVTLPVIREFIKLVAPFGIKTEAMQPAFGMAEVCTCMTYQNQFHPETGVHRVEKSSLGSQLQIANGEEKDTINFIDLGKPVPGVQIRITDEKNQLLPERVIGRFQIKGAVVTPGYLKNEAANQEAFVGEDWFNTGDLGFISHGHLILTGREKEQIIINGVNYYCYEIEEIVNKIEGVEPTYVGACGLVAEERGTEQLAIFFSPQDSATQIDLELIEKIKSKVAANLGIKADYVIPIESQDFPKTTSGKIQRSLLKKMLLQGEFDELIKELDIKEENALTIPNWFYHKAWRRKQANNQLHNLTKTTPILVFKDHLGLGQELCQKLNNNSQPSIQIEPGDNFTKVNNAHYIIAPDNLAHYQQLYQSLAADNIKIGAIVHLWHYDKYQGTILHSEALETAQSTGVYSLLFLLQTFGNQSPDYPVRLLYVASHSQSLNPQEPIAYQKATVPGLLKTIPQEMPHWHCRHLDLPLDPLEINSNRILEELTIDIQDSEVAYRDGERWVSGLEKFNLLELPKQPLPFRAGGTYLISGGLGGIGVEIAKYLLQHYQAKLLLLGRTPLPEKDSWEAYLQQGGKLAEKIQAYEQLQQLGGEVIYQAVDICNLTAVQKVVQPILSQWNSQLDGVIHLAGLMQERLLTEERLESFAQVLHPKLLGTWVLHQLVEKQPHSLFINFSSINGFFGGTTVGAYSAANSFLDRFSQYQRYQTQLNSYCLAWSMWDELGMSRGYQMKQLSEAKGYLPVGLSQGMSSLLASLGHAPADLMVGLDGSNLNIRRFIAQSDSLQQLTAYFTTNGQGQPNVGLLEPQIPDAVGKPSSCTLVQLAQMPLTETGDIDTELLLQSKLGRKTQQRVKPRNELEHQIAQIWQEVLGVSHIGIYDNFFGLGGHSLMATQVVSRIRERLSVELNLQSLFKKSDIASLAKELEIYLAQNQGIETEVITPRQKDSNPRTLSFAQQRLWFIEKTGLSGNVYNIPLTLHLVGKLNEVALQKSINQIITRHEALRTTFSLINDTTVQIIKPPFELELAKKELSGLTLSQQKIQLQQLLQKENEQLFNLEVDLPIRVMLLQLGATEHVLQVTLHHIASDGWSLAIFAQELSALYRAALQE